jgi:DNA (cytosine-5)-methyltransferase 1
MRYLSVCSGIEAATVAWHPLGWAPAAFSEIDKFPRAVLAHHYPSVPLHGDFTTIEADTYGAIDLLVGGTPCQDFSIAGLRAGVAGERGNLTLEFLRLAQRTRPRWLVWENVPGVLSSVAHAAPDPVPPTDPVDMGLDGQEVETEDEYDGEELHALNSFLAGLSELGYGYAYRTYDAQFFNLAQRRARVFVVGYLGDWRRAAAVLFERESLQGHPAPRREAGQRIANSLVERPDRGGGNSEGQRLIAEIAPTISARTKGGGGLGTDFDCDGGLIAGHRMTAFGEYVDDGTASTLKMRDYKDATDLITHALRGEGFDASEDGTGRGTPLVATTLRGRDLSRGVDSDCTDTLVAHAFDARQSDVIQYGDKTGPLDTDGHTIGVMAFSVKDHGADAGPLSPTLRAGGFDKSHANGGVMPAVVVGAFTDNGAKARSIGHAYEQAPTLGAESGSNSRAVKVHVGTAVRRLTPRECERLQGFPDDYTLVPWRKGMAPDGPRYKALGNSMAVPVMAWIGRRIAMVEAISTEARAA